MATPAKAPLLAASHSSVHNRPHEASEFLHPLGTVFPSLAHDDCPLGSSPTLPSHPQCQSPLLASSCSSTCIPQLGSPPLFSSSHVNKKLHPLKRPFAHHEASVASNCGTIIKLFGVDMKEESLTREALEANQHFPLSKKQKLPSPRSTVSALMQAPIAPARPEHRILRTMYECTFCERSFASSQAFGGHQNAHKRQRLIDKRIQMQGMMKAYKKDLKLEECHLYHQQQCAKLQEPFESLGRGNKLQYGGWERGISSLGHKKLSHPQNTIGFNKFQRGKSVNPLVSSLHFSSKALTTYMSTPSIPPLHNSSLVTSYMARSPSTAPKPHSMSLYKPLFTSSCVAPIATRLSSFTPSEQYSSFQMKKRFSPSTPSEHPSGFPNKKDYLFPCLSSRHQHKCSVSLNLQLSL